MTETEKLVTRRLRRASPAALGASGCAGMIASFVTPARASDAAGDRPSSSVLVGAFALADSIERTLAERDGSFSFRIEAAGLDIVWDSRAAGNDDGLGYGSRCPSASEVVSAGHAERRARRSAGLVGADRRARR